MNDALSARARRLIDNPHEPPFVKKYFESLDDLWSSNNPEGSIPMCVAENRLVWDLLEPRLAECRDLESHTIGYDAHVGSMQFRRVLADFVSRTFIGRKVDPECLAVLNGASSVLEILFYVLCDSGDGVLVPTPSYSGFWADLETRDEIKILPVHCTSEDQFALTTRALDEAIQQADRPVRALLLTNPGNPIGSVYTRHEVEALLGWAEDRGIHVVLDEIYALSVFGDREFISGALLRPEMGERLHIVWAFSKDFAVSGLRAGVLFSENRAVLEATQSLAMWAQVSTDTQSLLRQMLSDESWVDNFVGENQRRLGESYRHVTGVLESYGIPFVPSDAGFFFLIDVRSMMDGITWEAEDRLWHQLADELKVLLTPGSECHNGEPGFMRLVFAGVSVEAAVAAAHRIGAFARAAAG